MNKLLSKIIIIIILAILILPNISFGIYDITQPGTDVGGYNTVGESPQVLQNKAEKIVGLIRLVGTIVSVGALMAIGIKYMVSSVQEKAEYKKTFILYTIGALLLFTATLLPQIIYDISKQI